MNEPLTRLNLYRHALHLMAQKRGIDSPTAFLGAREALHQLTSPNHDSIIEAAAISALVAMVKEAFGNDWEMIFASHYQDELATLEDYDPPKVRSNDASKTLVLQSWVA